VDAIPVVEYTHPNALMQFTNADWVPQTMVSQCVQDGEFRIMLQYPFMFRDTRINYLASNVPASSFETDRKSFLGDNEYGTFQSPLGLRAPELRNVNSLRADNISALLHHLGTLQPGEARRLITQLGQAHNLEEARPGIENFRRAAAVENELAKMKAFWDEYLSAFQVETPDPS